MGRHCQRVSITSTGIPDSMIVLIVTAGCHLNTSFIMAVVYGSESLSDICGSLSLPTTRSSSACALACLSGWAAIASRNQDSTAVVYTVFSIRRWQGDCCPHRVNLTTEYPVRTPLDTVFSCGVGLFCGQQHGCEGAPSLSLLLQAVVSFCTRLAVQASLNAPSIS